MTDEGSAAGGPSVPWLTGIVTSALTLGAAGLAAVGVSQGNLSRAVRNHGGDITACLVVLIVGAVVLGVGARLSSPPLSPSPLSPAAPDPPADGIGVAGASGSTPSAHMPDWSGPAQVAVVVGAILLLAGVVGLVKVGGEAGGDREYPAVTLIAGAAPAATASAAAGAGSVVAEQRTLAATVNVRASNMRSDGDILVQVIAVRAVDIEGVAGGQNTALARVCEASHGPSARAAPMPSAPAADILLWNRQGPDGTGAVAASWTLQVPVGQYSVLCAWSAFSGSQSERSQTSSAYLRLPPLTSATAGP